MVDLVPHVLTEALALIDRHGWAQPGARHEGYLGAPYSPEASGYGGRCPHRALLDIAGATRVGGRAVRALSLAVAPKGRGTSIELVAWNDTRGRTLAQVRAAFRAAIEGAR